MNARRAVLLAVFVPLACAALVRGADTAAPAGDLLPVTLEVGFTPTAFLQGNRNDVQAAFKVLGEAIGRRRGYLVSVRTHFYSDSTGLFAAIDAGQVNFAVLDSLTYLSGGPRPAFPPHFTTARDGRAGRTFLLLTRRDGGARTIADLRGRRFVELEAPELSLGRSWVLSLLRDQGVTSCEQFFGGIEKVAKPSAAVLPVFFGRQDACLVDESAFRLMVELNPQVGTALQPVATSDPLVSAIVCAREDWPVPGFFPNLLRTLGELHLDPAGRQMLALFKIEQLLPFREEHLDNARRLLTAVGGAGAGPEASP